MPNWRSSTSSALRESNQRSRSATVRQTPWRSIQLSTSGGSGSSGTSTSLGGERARSSAHSSPLRQRLTARLPVESSRKAPAPRPSSQASAASRFSSFPSSRSGSVTVPGVTTRVTSRLTSPLASAGSSTWSQIATRSPARSSLPR